jgi:hypothetical protein
MSIISKAPYLRQQRNFPSDSPETLSVEMEKSYIDIATAVNARTIGVYPVNGPVVTGDSYYISGFRQQTVRQLFPFSSPNFVINHQIIVAQTGGFTKIYGTVVDSTGTWWPLPLVQTVSTASQVSLQVTPTQIVITVRASAPPIVSGFVILEWLAI